MPQQTSIRNTVAIGVLSLLCVGFAPDAEADVSYSYEGMLFNQSNPPFGPNDQVTGFMTFDTPVAPNLVGQEVFPKDWSFSLGPLSYSKGDANLLGVAFVVSTDSSGAFLDSPGTPADPAAGTSVVINGDPTSPLGIRSFILICHGAGSASVPTCGTGFDFGRFANQDETVGTGIAQGPMGTWTLTPLVPVLGGPWRAVLAVLVVGAIGLAASRRRLRGTPGLR